MTTHNAAAPHIAPSLVNVVGQEIQVVAFADPAQFPHGVDIIATAPGRLEPLGQVNIAPGSMLAVIPPAMALEVLRQMRAAQVVGQGAVRAPGAPK